MLLEKRGGLPKPGSFEERVRILAKGMEDAGGGGKVCQSWSGLRICSSSVLIT